MPAAHVAGWPEDRLNAVLQDAFSVPWTRAQLAVLGCKDGKESVAQSMQRVTARATAGGDEPLLSGGSGPGGGAAAGALGGGKTSGGLLDGPHVGSASTREPTASLSVLFAILGLLVATLVAVRCSRCR